MGELVRAYGLAKLFGLPSLAPPGPRPFVVMEVDGLRFAISVDRLMGQEEAVLKPLGMRRSYFSAAEAIAHRVAIGHTVKDGRAEVVVGFFVGKAPADERRDRAGRQRARADLGRGRIGEDLRQ